MSSDDPGLALAADVLAAQPFSMLLGTTIEQFGDGSAVLEVDIVDSLRQQHGLVHGGVLAYLVDNALTFACGTVLGPSILTRDVAVTYLAAARAGRLRATATVTAQDDAGAEADVVIDNITPDGDIRRCASGRGSAVKTRSET